MDDYDNAALEILTTAQVGNFWELRAARLAGTADGEIAAHQADQFAAMLTVDVVMEPERERDVRSMA